jgi:ankyrin repeat protein
LTGAFRIPKVHNGNLRAFMKAATAKPALLNARGPEGSTPFMYAVLYSNATTLAQLLKMGADVNAHNDANATALMWAAKDIDKTRVLVDHGADVNVRSDDLRTPLVIAARKPGGLRSWSFCWSMELIRIRTRGRIRRRLLRWKRRLPAMLRAAIAAWSDHKD